ncbi:MAG: hypothetical protein GH143_09865 [Calditrichaeota bacterium]|nr:hypothetical protein [Calditrichota bacterium]
MKNAHLKLIAGLTALMIAAPAAGQSLEETLSDMIGDNAKLYLGPVVTAFGTTVNSGTFRIARPHKVLGFDLTLNVSMAMLPDAAKTFDWYISPDAAVTIPVQLPGQPKKDVTLSLDDLYETDRSTSTFFGSAKPDTYQVAVDEDGAVDLLSAELVAAGIPQIAVDEASSQLRTLIRNWIPPLGTPGILDVPFSLMIVPQASLGLPLGIEVTLRGIPDISLGDAGKLSFFGYGAKIGLNQFIPTIPLVFPAFSVGYYATNLNVADIIEANNGILTLQISKSVPFLTVYGGLGLESSKMSVEYEFVPEDLPPSTIKFDLEGKNKTRIMLGGRLKLALLSINADYNGGEYKAYNIGIGLTLR